MDETSEETAEYYETDSERVFEFARDGRRVSIAQTRAGYAMLTVRDAGEKRERYYGLDMALDHAAELLRVDPSALPIPEVAANRGM